MIPHPTTRFAICRAGTRVEEKGTVVVALELFTAQTRVVTAYRTVRRMKRWGKRLRRLVMLWKRVRREGWVWLCGPGELAMAEVR